MNLHQILGLGRLNKLASLALRRARGEIGGRLGVPVDDDHLGLLLLFARPPFAVLGLALVSLRDPVALQLVLAVFEASRRHLILSIATKNGIKKVIEKFETRSHDITAYLLEF